jgi:hypothetical protein
VVNATGAAVHEQGPPLQIAGSMKLAQVISVALTPKRFRPPRPKFGSPKHRGVTQSARPHMRFDGPRRAAHHLGRGAHADARAIRVFQWLPSPAYFVSGIVA